MRIGRIDLERRATHGALDSLIDTSQRSRSGSGGGVAVTGVTLSAPLLTSASSADRRSSQSAATTSSNSSSPRVQQKRPSVGESSRRRSSGISPGTSTLGSPSNIHSNRAAAAAARPTMERQQEEEDYFAVGARETSEPPTSGLPAAMEALEITPTGLESVASGGTSTEGAASGSGSGSGSGNSAATKRPTPPAAPASTLSRSKSSASHASPTKQQHPSHPSHSTSSSSSSYHSGNRTRQPHQHLPSMQPASYSHSGSSVGSSGAASGMTVSTNSTDGLNAGAQEPRSPAVSYSASTSTHSGSTAGGGGGGGGGGTGSSTSGSEFIYPMRSAVSVAKPKLHRGTTGSESGESIMTTSSSYAGGSGFQLGHTRSLSSNAPNASSSGGAPAGNGGGGGGGSSAHHLRGKSSTSNIPGADQSSSISAQAGRRKSLHGGASYAHGDFNHMTDQPVPTDPFSMLGFNNTAPATKTPVFSGSPFNQLRRAHSSSVTPTYSSGQAQHTSGAGGSGGAQEAPSTAHNNDVDVRDYAYRSGTVPLEGRPTSPEDNFSPRGNASSYREADIQEVDEAPSSKGGSGGSGRGGESGNYQQQYSQQFSRAPTVTPAGGQPADRMERTPSSRNRSAKQDIKRWAASSASHPTRSERLGEDEASGSDARSVSSSHGVRSAHGRGGTDAQSGSSSINQRMQDGTSAQNPSNGSGLSQQVSPLVSSLSSRSAGTPLSGAGSAPMERRGSGASVRFAQDLDVNMGIREDFQGVEGDVIDGYREREPLGGGGGGGGAGAALSGASVGDLVGDGEAGPMPSENLSKDERTRLNDLLLTARFNHVETPEGHMIVNGMDGQLVRCEDEVSSAARGIFGD